MSRFSFYILLLTGGATFLRGLGRLVQPDYWRFLAILEAAKNEPTYKNRRSLHLYDFGFSAWPVDYKWNDKPHGEKVRLPNPQPPVPYNGTESRFGHILCWLAVHTFGRRMLYPGSVGIMQALLRPALEQGRTKLLEEHNARRYKLLTRSGYAVESMFVDRRGNIGRWPDGNILIITCEGNAGFLELGCMATPLECTYSVLGWNHPGFGGSEGVPWPDMERQAIEVVVQFAIEELGYPPDQIYIFAWSIGGFAATWATHAFPEIGGLVLDATFDDLVPLAIARMPTSWGRLVEESVREYLDLPIMRQLASYDGPVSVIRRTKDEVICMDDSSPESQKSSNRANVLLKELLRHRYPTIFTDDVIPIVDDWLNLDDRLRQNFAQRYNASDEAVTASLRQLISNSDPYSNGVIFPIRTDTSKPPLDFRARQMLAVFLVRHYFSEFDSTHCVPLPGAQFSLPHHPWELGVPLVEE